METLRQMFRTAVACWPSVPVLLALAWDGFHVLSVLPVYRLYAVTTVVFQERKGDPLPKEEFSSELTEEILGEEFYNGVVVSDVTRFHQEQTLYLENPLSIGHSQHKKYLRAS